MSLKQAEPKVKKMDENRATPELDEYKIIKQGVASKIILKVYNEQVVVDVLTEYPKIKGEKLPTYLKLLCDPNCELQSRRLREVRSRLMVCLACSELTSVLCGEIFSCIA